MRYTKKLVLPVIMLLLLISLGLNAYQYRELRYLESANYAQNKAAFWSAASYAGSNAERVEWFIELLAGKESAASSLPVEPIQLWDDILRSSHSIECQINFVPIYLNEQTSELEILWAAVSSANRALEDLNREFLTRDFTELHLTTAETAILAAVSSVYRLIGAGIEIDPEISLKTGVSDSLLEQIKIIDREAWQALTAAK